MPSLPTTFLQPIAHSSQKEKLNLKQPRSIEVPVVLKKNLQRCTENTLIRHAVGLLSQQVWCWGCDILRPEGNWLIEIGFKRIQPPAKRKGYSSVYALELPKRRSIVLRGFGVFYGAHHRGGVFLPRYEFLPKYTKQSFLKCPPWSIADLPKLSTPTESQQSASMSLTLDLIDWILNYEMTVIQQLGIEYRRSTLLKWNDGKRPFLPAEEFLPAWQELFFRVTANIDTFSNLFTHD